MSFPPPTASDIQEVVDLVVQTAGPLRVVLFGSAARGELRDGSDLDMMVVVSEGSDTLRIAQALHMAMGRERDLVARVGVDFVVTTPSRYEQGRASLGSVYREIDRDGQELYAAA